MRHLRVLDAPPFAVLEPQVVACERERPKRHVRRIVVIVAQGRLRDASPELPRFPFPRRKLLEVALAARDASGRLFPRAIDALREEEMPVGIDEPPFAVHLLRTEASRGLQLRALRPAAEAVRVWDAVGIRGDFRLLGRAARAKFVARMDLVGPLGEIGLSELVHPGTEGVGLQHRRRRHRRTVLDEFKIRHAVAYVVRREDVGGDRLYL